MSSLKTNIKKWCSRAKIFIWESEKLLGLLRTAVQVNPTVHRRMDEFYSQLSHVDFFQGKRGSIRSHKIMDEGMQGGIAEIQTSAMALI